MKRPLLDETRTAGAQSANESLYDREGPLSITGNHQVDQKSLSEGKEREERQERNRIEAESFENRSDKSIRIHKKRRGEGGGGDSRVEFERDGLEELKKLAEEF